MLKSYTIVQHVGIFVDTMKLQAVHWLCCCWV